MDPLKGIKLDSTQQAAIMAVLKERGIIIRDIAGVWDVAESSVSKILSGNGYLKPTRARALHELLGQQDSLAYLKDFYSVDTPLPGAKIRNPWESVYMGAAERLRPIFLSLPSDDKGELIRDLERLVDKYGKDDSELK